MTKIWTKKREKMTLKNQVRMWLTLSLESLRDIKSQRIKRKTNLKKKTKKEIKTNILKKEHKLLTQISRVCL